MAEKELWDGEMKQVVVAEKKILLLKVGGQIFAHEDRCVHQGVALSEGTLSGSMLTCAAHHWQYDACSGRSINPKKRKLKSFPVRIEDAIICIDLESDEKSNGY